MAQLAASGVAFGGEMYKARQVQKAKQQEQVAYLDASNRKAAATTRDVQEEQRKKEMLHSRAIALAAASGGGVDDPGVVKVLSDLSAEGEYRAMATLYTGMTEAQGLTQRATIARRESERAMTIGVINAITKMSAMAANATTGMGSPAPPGTSGGATGSPTPSKTAGAPLI